MTSIPLTMPVSITPPPGIIDDRYEIVHGEYVELPPMSAFASIIATRLVAELALWCRARGLGQAANETLFRLPLPDGSVSRRPDVAYVSYERWPRNRPFVLSANAWDVVPDLAVEVISPTDRAEDVLEKVEEYFRSGVRQVWVVYPIRAIVHVYESLASIRGLTRGDVLDGGTLLPEFRVKLAELFAEAAGSE